MVDEIDPAIRLYPFLPAFGQRSKRIALFRTRHYRRSGADSTALVKITIDIRSSDVILQRPVSQLPVGIRTSGCTVGPHALFGLATVRNVEGVPRSAFATSSWIQIEKQLLIRLTSFRCKDLRSGVVIDIINSTTRISSHFPSSWKRLRPFPCCTPRVMIDVIASTVFIIANFPTAVQLIS